MGNKENHQNNHKKHQPITYSEMYKIVIIGYIKTGKTTIIKKSLEGKEFNKTSSSIGIFGFPLEGRNIGVQICEYYINEIGIDSGILWVKKTDVFIFIYDISDKSTFVEIKKSMPKYKYSFEEKDALIILIGNKIDLPKREVQRNLGENLAKEYNAFFFETSAVTGEGINQFFELCMNNIVQRAKNEYHPNQENNLTLGSSMTPIPNVTKFSSPTEKPNNNNSINSQQDNYDKLYNDEKLKIEDLEKKITKLQNVNEYLEKELKLEREKNYNICTKENNSNEDPNKIIKLYDEISENHKEIKYLKGKLERFPFDLCENEKIMSVIISTEDKTILYSVIAKNTDKFLRVEEKFYDAFPEFGKVENSFYINGNKINKYQTLEENAIKNSELIIIKKENK